MTKNIYRKNIRKKRTNGQQKNIRKKSPFPVICRNVPSYIVAKPVPRSPSLPVYSIMFTTFVFYLSPTTHYYGHILPHLSSLIDWSMP